MCPSLTNCINFHLSIRLTGGLFRSLVRKLNTTRCHYSRAHRCACQFANMRELSLSFVCVELMPLGVTGACALSLFKGRDELFRAALAYATSFGPRCLNGNRNNPTHVNLWSRRSSISRQSSDRQGSKEFAGILRNGRTPQKREAVQWSQYARSVNWPYREWNEVTAWAKPLLNGHDKFRRAAPRYLMTVFLTPRRKAAGSPRASTGSHRPHSRNSPARENLIN